MQTQRVVALGFFDGVHIGHGALLQKTRQRADELRLTACAMSLDAPPAAVVSGSAAPLLGTMADRTLLMQRLYGIDEVVFEHFDRRMMALSWQAFIDDYLIGQLGAQHVVCGHDYRFGHHGAGTPALLAEYCHARGIGCNVIAEVTLDGVRVSSTAIREQLLRGELDTACRFLGHPHLLSGLVAHGRGLGRTIGVPTANIPIAPELLVPPHGVYCARAELEDGRVFPAVVNIGLHPTVGSLDAPVAEAWIDGLDATLYEKPLRLWLCHMLRSEQKFDSVQALCAQILHDRAQMRVYFSKTSEFTF